MRAWIALPLLLVACGKDEPTDDDTDVTDTDVVDTDDTDVVDTDDTDVALCADRTGGALIAFDVAGEAFTGWFTDATFIDAAKVHLDAGTTQVPVFTTAAGTDCDAQWSFHVEPTASFADVTIELCDGLPSYVDEHLGDFAQWCPWAGMVTAVDDRR